MKNDTPAENVVSISSSRVTDVGKTQRRALVPERLDLPDGDDPVETKIATFLDRVLSSRGVSAVSLKDALAPWICDALLSDHSIKAYGRDLVQFERHMAAQGVELSNATADDVKYYKRALLEAGKRRTSVSRKLSVIRGTYRQLADKGLVAWGVAQAIAAIEGPPLGRDQRNTTPCLTQKQAVTLLEAIPTETLQGVRDFALMSVFFITGCRVSAIIGACVGHLESDGVEHYIHVTEKRGKRRRKILLEAARAVLAYVEQAGIAGDKEGPLFRPMSPSGLAFLRRPMDRKTPWRLVKKYCLAAGINPTRLGGRGIGIHSLRKTAINDAIRNGAQMHEVREFAGHSDIRTTELYFARHGEDAEVAARKIQIRVGLARG